MASLNKSIGLTAFPLNPFYQTGKELRKVGAKFTVPTTGAIGDQYVLAGPFSVDDRINRILTQKMAALTSATTWNLGFYYSTDNLATQANLKPVVSGGGNELWSGVDLTTAVTTYLDVLTAKNGSLDNTKAIRDLLNIGPDKEPIGGVYLVLTNTTTANTAGGTIDLDIEVEQATTR